MRVPLCFSILSVLVAAVVASACAQRAKLSPEQTIGPEPTLPEPDRALLPTVKIAPAVGWKAGEMPTAAQGLHVQAFASGLVHPRWLYVLPNGDVLVAESNHPPTPDPQSNPIRQAFMEKAFAKAGADIPSPNRISLLRDKDGDGVAETKTVFAQNLFSPFGMALVGDRLYVANADALVSVPYKSGDTQVAAAPTKLADLPGAPRNHHWTKSLVANADGSKFYVGVGSNSNVAENGLDIEENRAAILEIDAATGASRVYAGGLRNPVGLAWAPGARTLWVVVNERDELGSDLVPDYLTSVKAGAFYGWPWSYFGPHVDARVTPARPDMVAKAIAPDFALGTHVAPLGLAFAAGTALPASFREGAFIGLHGSWNRDPPAGYKVVFVPFAGGKPAGKEIDVLTGFLDADGNARGRPVGVAMAKDGAVLVADDVGDVVWRVSGAR
jgi:glucose/arabinose dehydrogenase